jgi:transcription-repair coupling factor (superfamily II helicase)
MYAELLEETIAELRGLEREQSIDPEIRLGLSAFLPENYVPDPNQRLVFYKELAGAAEEDSIYAAADALRDRYGEIPEPGQLLLEVMKLRVLLKRLKIESVEYDGRQLVFCFHSATPVPPEKILALLDAPGGRCSFSPDFRLTVRIGKLPGREVLEAVKKEVHAFL